MILFTDIIHSVLDFLPFTDLSILIQLNHQYRDAVRTLQPRKDASLALTTSRSTILQQSFTDTSPLLAHVGEVTLCSCPQFSISEECNLLCHFPSLTMVEGLGYDEEEIDKEPSNCALALPSTITCIDIGCTRHSLQSVVNCLGNLPQLTDVEIYYMGKWINPEPNLAPLLKLTKLERLAIELVDPDKSTSDVDVRLLSFLQVIRQMKQLQNLFIDSFTDLDLDVLLQNSNPLLHLEDFPSMDRITDYSLQQLLTFPKLRTINGSRWSAKMLTLTRFPQLENLELCIDADSALIPTVADVVNSVSVLPLLQRWKFSHPFFTGDDLAAVLANLPKLETLELIQMDSLRHLAAFEQAKVMGNLWYIIIQDCTNLSSSEALKFRHLPSLRTLTFDNSFEERLCEFALQLFKPSSPFRIIPTLHWFEYRYPPDSDTLLFQ